MDPVNHRPAVLVADDEESDVLLLRLALERGGVPVNLLVARDGAEAVHYLAGGPLPGQPDAPARPNLFLLDLKMPRMSGFDVLEWLGARPELRDLPVLVLSSSSNEADVDKARTLGARDYLVKPTGLQPLTLLLQALHSRYLTAAPA